MESQKNFNNTDASINDDIVNSKKTLKSSSITTTVIIICWFSMFAEGYDLGVYGAVLPALLDSNEWLLTPATAGLIGSYALIGMILGNFIGGIFADLIGRKGTLISGIVVFSLMMILSAIAPTVTLLGISRFIGGIGLGAILPTAAALTVEYSPKSRRSFLYTLMFSGYCFGGVGSALTSFFLLEDLGWRVMFLIGAFPLLLIPFMIKLLPESVNFLISRNRHNDAEKITNRFGIDIDSVLQFEESKEKMEKDKDNKKSKGPLLSLFSRDSIKATVFFSLTYFMSMLLVYGLITWLPELMYQTGYSLGSSISFLLVLNLTAAFGALFAGVAADKWGSKLILVIAYFITAVCITLLSLKPSMFVTYTLIGFAGLGTIGSTMILSAYVLKYFNPWNRATAQGFTNGLGRLGGVVGPSLVGILMTLKFDVAMNFYVFATVGVLGSLAVLLIPKRLGKNI